MWCHGKQFYYEVSHLALRSWRLKRLTTPFQQQNPHAKKATPLRGQRILASLEKDGSVTGKCIGEWRSTRGIATRGTFRPDWRIVLDKYLYVIIWRAMYLIWTVSHSHPIFIKEFFLKGNYSDGWKVNKNSTQLYLWIVLPVNGKNWFNAVSIGATTVLAHSIHNSYIECFLSETWDSSELNNRSENNWRRDSTAVIWANSLHILSTFRHFLDPFEQRLECSSRTTRTSLSVVCSVITNKKRVAYVWQQVHRILSCYRRSFSLRYEQYIIWLFVHFVRHRSCE